jgi:hypothetical protein
VKSRNHQRSPTSVQKPHPRQLLFFNKLNFKAYLITSLRLLIALTQRGNLNMGK